MKSLTSFTSEEIGGKKTWRGMKSTFDNLELFYSEIGEDEELEETPDTYQKEATLQPGFSSSFNTAMKCEGGCEGIRYYFMKCIEKISTDY